MGGAMGKQDNWLENHVQFIGGLQNPSDQQKLLLLLLKKQNPLPTDLRQIERIICLEKAIGRAQRASVKVRGTEVAERSKDRKKRTRMLIQMGALIEMAGLAQKDPAELLGMLLTAAKVNDPAKWERWKSDGVQMLSSRSKSSKN